MRIAGARDAALAHAAGHDGRVAGHAAGRGEDALGGVHAVDVLGRGLAADEEHRLARLACALGVSAVKTSCPTPRRARPAGRWRRHALLSPRIEARVQQLVESSAGSTRRRLVAVDEPLLRPCRRRSSPRRAGALAGAGLQHVERAALDRELDVLHVAVVLLERRRGSSAAARRPSASPLLRARAIGCGVRMPATTSSPCALIRYSP